MTDDVGKRFLENAKEGGVQLLIQNRFVDLSVHFATNPRPVLKFVGLPFQRRCQTKMVEHAGTQLSGNAPDHLDR